MRWSDAASSVAEVGGTAAVDSEMPVNRWQMLKNAEKDEWRSTQEIHSTTADCGLPWMWRRLPLNSKERQGRRLSAGRSPPLDGFRAASALRARPHGARGGVRGALGSRTLGRSTGMLVSPLRLRHTVATLMLNQSIPLTTIGAVLGHTDARTTLVYARVAKDTKTAAISTLGEFLDAL